MLAGDVDSLIRPFRCQYDITILRQHRSRELSERLFVLNEQYRFGAAQEFDGADGPIRAYGFCRTGQVNLERGAVTHFAVNPDEAPALLDHAIDSRQP